MDAPAAVTAEDPLAQPTRARLFALLSELRRPAGTAELAERLDLHPNGIRIHLERMEEAGLVERSRAAQPRGRPRDAGTVAAGARPGGAAPSGYQDLGRWLARTLKARPRGPRSIEETGRQIGRELAPTGAEDGAEALQAALKALGFQPSVTSREADRLTVCLGNCPYRDAVHENQADICTLHRGITRGLLEGVVPGATLAGFVPRDPDAAGCLIELTGVDPTPGPA